MTPHPFAMRRTSLIYREGRESFFSGAPRDEK
jgi:hypothetical protein